MESRTVLIVEDEYIIAEHLRGILSGLGYAVQGVAGSVAEALAHLQEQPPPSVVLLDIMLGGNAPDGIDLAHRLRAAYAVPFIFITSLTDTATLDRAKLTRPHGYVVKPFTTGAVHAALEMAFANYAAEHSSGAFSGAPAAEELAPSPSALPDSLFVREGRQFTRIRFRGVLWVQAEGNYSTVHTRFSKHTLLSSLKELEERLPGADFIRVHKSYLVALGEIAAVDTQGVLVGNKRIPVGRAYQAELMRRLNLLGTL